MNLKHITAILVLTGMLFSGNTLADDLSDVMKVIQQYGDLENDLAAQAKLMRSDRVYISGGVVKLTKRRIWPIKSLAVRLASL